MNTQFFALLSHNCSNITFPPDCRKDTDAITQEFPCTSRITNEFSRPEKQTLFIAFSSSGHCKVRFHCAARMKGGGRCQKVADLLLTFYIAGAVLDTVKR